MHGKGRLMESSSTYGMPPPPPAIYQPFASGLPGLSSLPTTTTLGTMPAVNTLGSTISPPYIPPAPLSLNRSSTSNLNTTYAAPLLAQPMEPIVSSSRNQYNPALFPPPGGYQDYNALDKPPMMPDVDRLNAAAAAHESRVSQLEAGPRGPNLEGQIRELLEGQRAIRAEIEEIKNQVGLNYHDIQNLKRNRAPQNEMQRGYYDGPPNGNAGSPQFQQYPGRYPENMGQNSLNARGQGQSGPVRPVVTRDKPFCCF